MRLGLEEQPAAALEGFFGWRELVQLQTFLDQDLFLSEVSNSSMKSVGLAHVARHLGHADLGIVEFFQHGHRQIDVMLLKFE